MTQTRCEDIVFIHIEFMELRYGVHYGLSNSCRVFLVGYIQYGGMPFLHLGWHIFEPA
jgi:hypothetical protein